MLLLKNCSKFNFFRLGSRHDFALIHMFWSKSSSGCCKMVLNWAIHNFWLKEKCIYDFMINWFSINHWLKGADTFVYFLNGWLDQGVVVLVRMHEFLLSVWNISIDSSLFIRVGRHIKCVLFVKRFISVIICGICSWKRILRSTCTLIWKTKSVFTCWALVIASENWSTGAAKTWAWSMVQIVERTSVWQLGWWSVHIYFLLYLL